MKKKLYIAGCGGMLGIAFHEVFKKEYELKCTDIDVNEKWLSFLDFRNYNNYLNDVSKFHPDYLLHLGAITDLEYCELNQKEAYETNTLSVEHATHISNKLKIPLLYISTAGIFDGSKETYDDWDEPKPLGHYGNSKFLGEKFIQSNSNKYIICRAGWMMGGGIKKDKKFVNKIISQIINGKKTLNIVNDKLGTPTYTYDFAKNMKLILEKEKWDLFNLVCEGETGRLEVAKEIVKILNMEKNINIQSVESSFFSKEYFAKRPDSERLINKKLNQTSLNIMRNWKICLKEYIFKEYSKYILKS